MLSAEGLARGQGPAALSTGGSAVTSLTIALSLLCLNGFAKLRTSLRLGLSGVRTRPTVCWTCPELCHCLCTPYQSYLGGHASADWPGSTLRPIGSHGGLALLCTLSLCQLRPCGTWLRVCVRLCVPLHQHTAQRNCSPDPHKIHRVPTLLGVGTPPPADPELLLLLWVVVVPTFHHPAASPSLGRNWMVARLRTGCDSSDTPVYWACPQS